MYCKIELSKLIIPRIFYPHCSKTNPTFSKYHSKMVFLKQYNIDYIYIICISHLSLQQHKTPEGIKDINIFVSDRKNKLFRLEIA